MSLTRSNEITEEEFVKLAFFFLGGLAGIAAVGLGFVPLWAIAPFAAGGLLAWGVVEYVADRPVSHSGEEVKHT